MAVSEKAKKDFLKKCIESKDFPMVEIMLKVGTPIDTGDFRLAINNADYKMLDLLFKNASKEIKEQLGTRKCYGNSSTILHESALSGNVRVSKVVLENLDEYKDYLIKEINIGFYTPLQLAALKGDLESVIYLSQQCLDLDYIEYEKIKGTSAVDLASGQHKEEMVIYLNSLSNELSKNKEKKKLITR
jgi:hypothetical protein